MNLTTSLNKNLDNAQKLKTQQNSKHSQHVESYLRSDIVVNRIYIKLVFTFKIY